MLAVAATLFAGLSAAADAGPSVKELRSAPESLTVDKVALNLEVYAWRDFQPGLDAAPGGRPLRVVVKVTPRGGGNLPEGLTAVALYAVQGDEVWRPRGWERNERTAAQIEAMAAEGPKWAPRSKADVIVRLRDKAGGMHLLRAARQEIQRTD
jgi:hypothetical protein